MGRTGSAAIAGKSAAGTLRLQQRNRHPRFSMSSSGAEGVGPGGGFVVEAAGLQAAVQDADEPIGELAQCGLVTDLAGSERVVVGACAGRSFQGAEGPLLHGVAQPRVAGVAG